MYVLKNAFRSISRSKVRSILISVIILVVAVSTCVALSIREAASTARETLLSELEITASISLDRSSMMDNFKEGGSTDDSSADSDTTTDSDTTQSGGTFNKEDFQEQMAQLDESLSLDELQTYAESDNVKSFYYTLSTSVNGTDDFEAVDTTGATTTDSDTTATDSDTTATDSDTTSTDDNTAQPGGDMLSVPDMGGDGKFGSQGDFTIIGYSCDEAMTDFIDGNSVIESGAVFEEGTSEAECIIPSELATYNSISVGDTISVCNPNNEDEVITLTVVGIYSESESSDGEMTGFSVSQDSANRILMSSTALSAIIDASSEADSDNALASQLNGTYTFADVDKYEAFTTEVYDLGLDESYTVSSQDYNAYEQSLQPIENLSTYALYFLVVVLIIGAIILIVINIFNIRERKYEIGVMAAIGMKKGKIAAQFVSEMLIITLVTVIIGTGIGAAISVPVGNALLSAQTESSEQQQTQMNENFGRDFQQNSGAPSDMPSGDMPSGSTDSSSDSSSDSDSNSSDSAPTSPIGSYVSEISASVNLTVFAQLMGIAILLSLLASGVSVIFVLRYDPMKILSNRD